MSVENRWEVAVDLEWHNADSTSFIELEGYSIKDLSDFCAWLEEMLTATIDGVA